MSLKQEVDIGSELYSLTRWHGQQTVVIQYGVERLNPLWIDVSITHNPRSNLYKWMWKISPGNDSQNEFISIVIAKLFTDWLFDYLSGSVC